MLAQSSATEWTYPVVVEGDDGCGKLSLQGSFTGLDWMSEFPTGLIGLREPIFDD